MDETDLLCERCGALVDITQNQEALTCPKCGSIGPFI